MWFVMQIIVISITIYCENKNTFCSIETFSYLSRSQAGSYRGVVAFRPWKASVSLLIQKVFFPLVSMLHKWINFSFFLLEMSGRRREIMINSDSSSQQEWPPIPDLKNEAKRKQKRPKNDDDTKRSNILLLRHILLLGIPAIPCTIIKNTTKYLD